MKPRFVPKKQTHPNGKAYYHVWDNYTNDWAVGYDKFYADCRDCSKYIKKQYQLKK